MGPKKIKAEAPQQRKGSSLMKQMGLFQDEESGGEEDLEAELRRLTGSAGSSRHQAGAKKPGKALVSVADIEKLALQSAVGLDADDDDEDVDYSGDEDDLMAELQELGVSDGEDTEITSEAQPLRKAATGSGSDTVAVLEERTSMYASAMKQCADDESKRRRLERGLKTLNDLLKAAKSGKPIDESSIPPPVTVKPRAVAAAADGKDEQHAPATGQSAPAAEQIPAIRVQPPVTSTPVIGAGAVGAPSSPALRASDKETLLTRRDAYKHAALIAKAAGDMDSAKQHLFTAKKLDAMISAVDSGTPIDISTIPAAPSVPDASGLHDSALVRDSHKPMQSPGPLASAPGSPRPKPSPLPGPPSPVPLSSPVRPPALVAAATSPAPFASPPEPATLQKRAPVQAILDRQQQYKVAALQAKKNGDLPAAKKFLVTAKGLDSVIAAVAEGKPAEEAIAALPPPLLVLEASAAVRVEAAEADRPAREVHSEVLKQASAGASGPSQVGSGGGVADEGSYLTSVGAPTQEEAAKLFGAPTAAPTSLLEALQQRKEKYHASEQEATTEGNSGKARRMNRIVKQYDDAIKACRSGKPFDLSELPVPPGFAQLPPERSAGVAHLAAAVSGDSAAATLKTTIPAAQPASTPASTLALPSGGSVVSGTAGMPSPQKLGATPAGKRDGDANTAADTSPMPPKRQASLSINEKQYQQLMQRQQEYRSAAVEAKRGGDLELAKNYLRLCKGLDGMISASRNGLPVNMQSMPPPPPSSYAPQFVMESDDLSSAAASEPQLPVDREDEFKKLIEALKQQIGSCSTNAAHYRQLGDITSANKFEAFEQNHRKDMDALRNAFKHGDPVPKYHFETKTFPMIQCNTELGDNDLEVSIVQGTQFGAPEGYQEKDVHTYVTFTFPFPQEEQPKFSTHTFKASSNPAYKETFKITIDRKSHKFLRIVKNKNLKLEVYYKRGFLKEDRVLGSVSAKLETLEDKCTVHECLDLMDGRKAVGGKLEFKLRLRKPLLHEQVEVVTERWLTIDQFIRKALPVAEKLGDSRASKQPSNPIACGAKPQSIEVLVYEKRMLDEQIRQLQSRLSPDHLAQLKQKSRDLMLDIDRLTTALRDGSLIRESYFDSIRGLPAAYVADAKAAGQAGEEDKMKKLLEKAKIVKHEIESAASKGARK